MKPAGTNFTPNLSVTELHWKQGVRTILSDISFTTARGARVGLLGANGSGKSTLMKCLVGLQPFDSGQVEIFGKNLDQIDDEIRARLAYVPQSPGLFSWMTVEQHLRVIGQAYPNWTEKRAIELALALELSLGKLVSKLSGGDQQKLAIVLALAHQPDLILMDEPVANLDPVRRSKLMRQLFIDHTWIAQDATVIFTSHLLGDLEDVLSQVIFLHQGRLQLCADWPAFKQQHRIVSNQVLDTILGANTQHGNDQVIVHRGAEQSLVQFTAFSEVLEKISDSGVVPLNLDTLFHVLQQ